MIVVCVANCDAFCRQYNCGPTQWACIGSEPRVFDQFCRVQHNPDDRIIALQPDQSENVVMRGDHFTIL